MSEDAPRVSIILPAFNESGGVAGVVTNLKQAYPQWEILVVDDGSTDGTGILAEQAGARVVRHPKNLGNGAAIKTGARRARGYYLIFMDADGQHDVRLPPALLDLLAKGYDMAVGARAGDTQAGWVRRLGNAVLNRFASLMTEQSIPDLTSGVRATRATTFRRFLYLLPNGFSYPTTITMAYMRSGLAVGFLPIRAKTRIGKSKISLFRDGTKFLLIIMKVITLYSPLRIFFPASLSLFLLALGWYLHVFTTTGRLTNMPVLLFTASMLTFLIGLVSEQITTLHLSATQGQGEDEDKTGP